MALPAKQFSAERRSGRGRSPQRSFTEHSRR